ncbi:MAG: hypothetical protein ACRDIY_05070 [Chloroflexota bacterium]
MAVLSHARAQRGATRATGPPGRSERGAGFRACRERGRGSPGGGDPDRRWRFGDVAQPEQALSMVKPASRRSIMLPTGPGEVRRYQMTVDAAGQPVRPDLRPDRLAVQAGLIVDYRARIT